MKTKKTLKLVLFIITLLLLTFLLRAFLMTGILFLISKSAKVEVNTDITKYNDYIGENAKEEYKNKWDMKEEIFPKKVDNLNVLDYKMVYYNLWDAEYLSYLVVDYDEASYQEERNRLEKLGIENYVGYYGVTGFTNYKLLAMTADAYQGFVYAITDEKEKIIYVEIIFCNYFMDLDYKKYMKEEYFPDNFDAKLDNAYQRKMTKNKK